MGVHGALPSPDIQVPGLLQEEKEQELGFLGPWGDFEPSVVSLRARFSRSGQGYKRLEISLPAHL